MSTPVTIAEQGEFHAWFAKVDRMIENICGLGADDLTDFAYWDYFAMGAEPREVAEEVLADNGFPFEV